MTGVQRTLLHLSFALSALSGIAYGAFKYFGPGDDPYSAAGHPLQPWALAAHVVISPVLIWAFGWIFSDHVLRKLGASGDTAGTPAGVGRISGLASLWLLPPLILSGAFVQTTTGDWTHRAAVWVHLATGAGVLAAYLIHAFLSRLASSRFVDFAGLVARARRAGL